MDGARAGGMESTATVHLSIAFPLAPEASYVAGRIPGRRAEVQRPAGSVAGMAVRLRSSRWAPLCGE
jgi:hypothetical protein